MSPIYIVDPYVGPVELLLCLNYPLYIPQPFFVSLKASVNETSGLDTPIFINEPFVIYISK